MEKRAQLYEIIIKLLMAIIAFITGVFVAKNAVFMLPLFESVGKSEVELYEIIYATSIGDILKDIGVIVNVDLKIILKGFTAFLLNVEWISIVFLLVTLVLLMLSFVFVKWKLVKSYSRISLSIIGLYILKYLLFLLSFALIYKNGEKSMAMSFIVGNSLFMICSFIELFLLCLFVVKFILNIVGDIKYYLES